MHRTRGRFGSVWVLCSDQTNKIAFFPLRLSKVHPDGFKTALNEFLWWTLVAFLASKNVLLWIHVSAKFNLNKNTFKRINAKISY